MPTIDFITALGRLLSDPRMRESFRHDPEMTLDNMSLKSDVRHALLSIDSDHLQAQAEILLGKRLREVGTLLPRSIAGLSGEGSGIFSEYANQSWPTGHLRHLQDAVNFGCFLSHRRITGLDYIEWNRLRFIYAKKRLGVYWVPRLHPSGKRKRAVQVFFSLARRTRHEYLFYFAV